MENRLTGEISLGDWMRSAASDWKSIAAAVGIVSIIAYFYGVYQLFGVGNQLGALHWLKNNWTKETDYQHGYFIPVIIVGLIFWDRKNLAASPVKGSNLGLWIILGAVLFFLLSKRTVQARVAVASFPILLTGISMFLWGWPVTKRLLFPFFLIGFAVPIPQMIQATNGLQIIATKTAYSVSSLLGADVIVAGNNIKSTTGAWGDESGFHIAEGCSGIRSLVALTLVAAVYGYVTTQKAWKVAVLIVASIPLAILANAARVTTIILIAEYISPDFAARTYHNWSGFLFFPIGLFFILVLGVVLNGGTAALRVRKKTVTYVNAGEKSEAGT